jgi:hypothetical protein
MFLFSLRVFKTNETTGFQDQWDAVFSPGKSKAAASRADIPLTRVKPRQGQPVMAWLYIAHGYRHVCAATLRCTFSVGCVERIFEAAALLAHRHAGSSRINQVLHSVGYAVHHYMSLLKFILGERQRC